MLLAIDTGNTNTLFAVHDGESWRAQWRSATDMTKTADDYAVWLTQLMALSGLKLSDITDCIISTVVPQSLFNTRNLSRRYLNIEPFVIGENVELGIPVRMPKPEEVGADRLVNAIGAHSVFGGPLIVIDSGTATTFDIIGEDGGFEGGIIAPGINLSMKALHEAAAKLPRISIQKPAQGQVIGKDTVSAMQSGVFWGYIDLIDGLVERIKAEYGRPMTVIGTGGVVSLFQGSARTIDHYDSDVTIRGLLLLYERKPVEGEIGAEMKGDELLFAPLGGCREIGMNLNAYAYGPPKNRRWIVVDVGVTFGDDTTPGVDLIMPDPVYLEGQKDNIEAIILTHAHEDHIGAIAWLWPKLRAPIYATPFTAFLVREKLRERGLDKEAEVNILPLRGRKTFGPFDVEMVTLTHSIPEPNGLAIRTPLGMILHTGDWKIDPDPLIGEDFDQAKIEELGREGILAIVCDSTNVFEEGEAGSEGTARAALIEAVAQETGRVAITSFASNVARVESACVAAKANGRGICLVGRSMMRITAAARSVGMLEDVDFLEPAEASALPPDKILYLCTGSQGEPRAALAKIAKGEHPFVKLSKGDAVIFSSRVIPGNERSIGAIQNLLADREIKLVTPKHGNIHVSGHPCRDELRRMYLWAKPKISVPVHGERRHIMEHARYALSLQVPQALTPNNGDVIRLAPGSPAMIDEAPTGRLYLDGQTLTPEAAGGMWERKKIAWNGYVGISVVLDTKKVIDGPVVVVKGFSEPDGRPADESLEALDTAADAAMRSLKKAEWNEDEAVEKALTRAVRRAAEQTFGKRPLVDVVIHRL